MRLAVSGPDIYFNPCRSQFTCFTAEYEFSKFEVCPYYRRDKWQHLTEFVGFPPLSGCVEYLIGSFPFDDRI